MKLGFFPLYLFVFAVSLAPIFWYLWIVQGSGNPNFFFAICLFLAFVQMIFLLDLIKAYLLSDVLELNKNISEDKLSFK